MGTHHRENPILKYHYSLFAVQLADGCKKILNLDAISQVSIESNACGKLCYWIFLIDGESVMLPEAEGHRLERAWSIFLTAKFAQHHVPVTLSTGQPNFPTVENSLLISTYLADAAHNAHLNGEGEDYAGS